MTASGSTWTIHDAAEDGDVAAVQRFLADGVGPNDRSGYSRLTPLMHASSPEVVRVLLDAGCDPHPLNEYGEDALQLIIQGDPFEMERSEGEPLARRSAMADLLVGAGVDLERAKGAEKSRIYSAAREPYPIAVAYLLERGVRCDERDEYGDTLLHTLCWRGFAAADSEEFDTVSDTIRRLVHAGVPIEARDDSGETPLHEAAYGDFENVPAVRTLIELGAEVDALHDNDCTPLELAASRGEANAVALLLEAGADPVRRSPKGWRFWRRGWNALACARNHAKEMREIAAAEPGQLASEALAALREVDEPDKERISAALEESIDRERAEPEKHRATLQHAIEEAERTLALLEAVARRRR